MKSLLFSIILFITLFMPVAYGIWSEEPPCEKLSMIVAARLSELNNCVENIGVHGTKSTRIAVCEGELLGAVDAEHSLHNCRLNQENVWK